ncbi:lipid A deacylase LpxR family protein [Natronospira bacteriovora]|uniref:Lipid A deacylase LpxR family protein n=1 Tax=Natronospira bacteriovora TaxID=3069753 RepID=A0ABU0W4R2_9GAMM|nr:lipid A deacylase LpxR family protein [Natronospira sp. AB-CW4]MDQ2069004.1 lipid A deacylase LpxR family protein [Natronospira sp. AB-CW4]
MATDESFESFQPRRPRRRRAGLLLVVLLASLPATAETVPEPLPRQLITVEAENDFFVGQDGGYTNGLRLSWTNLDRELPEWMQNAARAFPLFPDTDEAILWGTSLIQTIFTPESITDPQMPPDDRPYAGWLGLGFHMASVQRRRMDRLTLAVGVVGPASGARRTQTFIHEVLGSDRPVGWETQLPNEAGLLLAYDNALRMNRGPTGNGRYEWEFTPSAGFVLGNIITEGRVGFYHRIGRNIPRDFGPPRISAAPNGSGLFRPLADRGWYAFWGMDLRYVVHNIFLDGSLIQETPSVDSRPWVGEIFGGGALQWGRNRLTYTSVARSREFDSQDLFELYGAVSYSRLF